MRSASFLAACPLLVLVASGALLVGQEAYQSGELIRLTDEERAAPERHQLVAMYLAEVKAGDIVYGINFLAPPGSRPAWAAHEIHFRLDKGKMLVKQDGGDLEFTIAFVLRDNKPQPTASEGGLIASGLAPPNGTPEQAIKQAENWKPKDIPRCNQIAEAGPQFKALAQACNFALSPSSLPNFICHETVHRFRSNLEHKNWKSVDVMTEEVTFAYGRELMRGDDYENFTVNGKPIKVPEKLHGPAREMYVEKLHPKGFGSFADFGMDLATIFDPRNKVTLRLEGPKDVGSAHVLAVAYHIDVGNNLTEVFCGGEQCEHPGLEGVLYLDSADGNPVRLEEHSLAPAASITGLATATNYALTPIADLGDFVLPVDSETIACQQDHDVCYRNELKFSECRKFAAQSKIVPATQ